MKDGSADAAPVQDDGARVPIESGAMGTVTTLTSAEFPVGLALANGNVYYLGGSESVGIVLSGGSLNVIAAPGGEPVTLIDQAGFWFVDASPPPYPFAFNGPSGLAVDNDDIYWTNAGVDPLGQSEAGAGGGVVRIPLTGGVPVQIATGASHRIAVDADSVFWVQGSVGALGTLMRAAKGGGPAVTLASGVVGEDFAMDGENVYVPLQQADASIGIAKIGKADNSMTVLALAQRPAGLVVGAKSVYWGEELEHAIQSVPIAGGTGAQLITTTTGTLRSLATDDISVYWTSEQGVQKVDVDGGAATSLVTEVAGATSLAVDSTSVYWLVPGGSGSIRRLSPK